MKSVLIASIALIVLAVMPAAAVSPVTLEHSHEVGGRMLSMPSSLEGSVEVQACTACKRMVFAISPEVRFQIANRQVSFGEMKQYVAAHPDAVMLLVTSPQNIVTRLAAP
jgi:hypothetical protein